MRAGGIGSHSSVSDGEADCVSNGGDVGVPGADVDESGTGNHCAVSAAVRSRRGGD